MASILIPGAAAVKAARAGALLKDAGELASALTKPAKTLTPGKTIPSALHTADGLTEELREQIVAMKKGSRPDPSTYLSPSYIQQHLEQFDEGATRFMTESNLHKYGLGQRDGTVFVCQRTE